MLVRLFFFKNSSLQKSLCENFLTKQLQSIAEVARGKRSGTLFEDLALHVVSLHSEIVVQGFSVRQQMFAFSGVML